MVKKAFSTKPSPSPPPFNWDASWSPSPPSDPQLISSAPTAWLETADMKIYGGQPITSTSDIGVVKCKDCNKPILRSCFLEHMSICADIRKRAQSGTEANKSAKKRKASVEPADPAGEPPKKKSKGTTKPRAKGPVDYDRQCGVINDKGLPCSRSLTCKSHSMGAKRSVLGRSKKYDDLLLDWQRANNPNFVEPVKRESKAEKKEKREKEKQEKKRLLEEAAPGGKKLGLGEKNKKNKKLAAAATMSTSKLADSKTGEMEENLDDLDSEAEVDTLVQSIRTAREKGIISQPLAVPGGASSWFVARRERARCVRDLMGAALGGMAGSATIGGLGMGRASISARP